MQLHHIPLFTGFLLLLHAAYSASLVKNADLPIDIILQTLIAFVLTAAGTVWHYGKFYSIVSSNDQETYTSDFLSKYKSSSGFMTFKHRGQCRAVY